MLVALPRALRFGAGLGLAVLLLVAVAGPVSAQTEPDITALACPAEEVPTLEELGLQDAIGTTFAREIACLAHYGITRGTRPGQFEPNRSVTRDQMATFFERLLDYAAQYGRPRLPAYDGTNVFTDVDPARNPHVRAINRLAAADIVRGGPGGRPGNEYGPSLPVTRAQMASFINRAQQYLATAPFPAAPNPFTDIADAGPHIDNIAAIAGQGIARGDGSGQYRPFAPASRGQMAAFLVRHIGVNIDEGRLVTPGVLRTLPVFRVTATGDREAQIGAQLPFQVETPLDGEHVIQLLPEDAVETEPSGASIFDLGAGEVDAVISRVNDQPVPTPADRVEATPANGRILFHIQGVASESVVPVVFRDEDGNGVLTVREDGTVVDDYYGVGPSATFAPAPVDATGIDPPGGGPGATVTITGTGFQPDATVTFADTEASTVTVVDDTTITATVPTLDPTPTGPIDVTVRNPDGGEDTLPAAFTYEAPPPEPPPSPPAAPAGG